MENKNVIVRLPIEYYHYLMARGESEQRRPGNLARVLLMDKIDEEIRDEPNQKWVWHKDDEGLMRCRIKN